MNESGMTGAMRILTGVLQARTGQRLAESRMWRLETSLKPLLREHGLTDLDGLVERLATDRNGTLGDQVVDALLNNESSFFRDLRVFQTLEQEVLPHLAQTRQEKTLRIWCAGSSTGQEPYSIAMMIRRNLAQWDGWRISILGTDISRSAVEQARSGQYSQIDVQRGLAINDLLRWFEPAEDCWRISDDLRSMVDFRVDNLLNPSMPSGQYDLIFCRNVMLYFSPEVRSRAFAQLARYAAPDGLLLLGAGETVIGQTDAFVKSEALRGVYVRAPQAVVQPGLRALG